MCFCAIVEIGRAGGLKVLKTIHFLTNSSLIYKWALCQVPFENLKIMRDLKTLYAGTEPTLLGKPKFILIADDIQSGQSVTLSFSIIIRFSTQPG